MSQEQAQAFIAKLKTDEACHARVMVLQDMAAHMHARTDRDIAFSGGVRAAPRFTAP